MKRRLSGRMEKANHVLVTALGLVHDWEWFVSDSSWIEYANKRNSTDRPQKYPEGSVTLTNLSQVKLFDFLKGVGSHAMPATVKGLSVSNTFRNRMRTTNSWSTHLMAAANSERPMPNWNKEETATLNRTKDSPRTTFTQCKGAAGLRTSDIISIPDR